MGNIYSLKIVVSIDKDRKDVDYDEIGISTLGCPGWSWEEIYATCKDLGIKGIEVRGIESEIYAPNSKPFRAENIDKTLETLKKLDIEIPMLTSGAYLFDKEKQEEAISEAKAYIDLAQRIGTPYIRVLGDKDGAPGEERDLDFVKTRYQMVCDYAINKNVIPLIETNGVLADSGVMAEFIKAVDRPNVGILWDIHHPYRYFKETPETTLNYLNGYIKYVHIKDSVMETAKYLTECQLHDVLVLDCLKQLNKNGFEGRLWNG